MKRYDPRRADSRPIEEKALGLIFAMTDDEAARLQARLLDMATALDSARERMFVGNKR